MAPGSAPEKVALDTVAMDRATRASGLPLRAARCLDAMRRTGAMVTGRGRKVGVCYGLTVLLRSAVVCL